MKVLAFIIILLMPDGSLKTVSENITEIGTCPPAPLALSMAAQVQAAEGAIDFTIGCFNIEFTDVPPAESV